MLTANKNYCNRCKETVDEGHWRWEKDSRYKNGGKWRCRIYIRAANKKYREKIKSDPIRLQKSRDYHNQWFKDHSEVVRYKSIKSTDKAAGRTDTMSLDDYRNIIKDRCTYCEVTNCDCNISLDRLDNNLGHTIVNCVPCCEICNFILCDLPQEAKKLIGIGLLAARRSGELNNWVIPTKRKVQ
jgi:hypothetical protein